MRSRSAGRGGEGEFEKGAASGRGKYIINRSPRLERPSDDDRPVDGLFLVLSIEVEMDENEKQKKSFKPKFQAESSHQACLCDHLMNRGER